MEILHKRTRSEEIEVYKSFAYGTMYWKMFTILKYCYARIGGNVFSMMMKVDSDSHIFF